MGNSWQTVVDWRKRFADKGIAGIIDAPQSGRPSSVDEAEVIARTPDPPPERLGVTHWSTRLLAAELGISNCLWSVRPVAACAVVPPAGDEPSMPREQGPHSHREHWGPSPPRYQ